MTPETAIKNLYHASRQATLSASDHQILQEAFQIALAAVTPPPNADEAKAGTTPAKHAVGKKK